MSGGWLTSQQLTRAKVGLGLLCGSSSEPTASGGLPGHLNHRAAKLSLVQAATLAGVVQRPSTTNHPIRHPGPALARRNIGLDRMNTLGLVTNKAWMSAKKTMMVTHPQPAQSTCALSRYPHFCRYVSAWLLDQPALGKTRADRVAKINRGGLTIQTTLKPKMQPAAQQALTAKVPIDNPADIGAAVAAPITHLRGDDASPNPTKTKAGRPRQKR